MATESALNIPFLTYEAGNKSLHGRNLKRSASINGPDGLPTPIKLDLLGAAILEDTVMVVPFKIYLIQLFSDNKGHFVRNPSHALTSLSQNASWVAIRIEPLRHMSGGKLRAYFEKYIKPGEVDANNDAKALMGIFENSAEMNNPDTITLLLTKDHKNKKLFFYFEDKNRIQTSRVCSANLMQKFLSIWLGTPLIDSHAEKLMEELMKPVY